MFAVVTHVVQVSIFKLLLAQMDEARLFFGRWWGVTHW